ncbi:RHS repeat-associated core domain-containing protein [Chryseobacterium sp.]|uniref:RHS repeat-associated core domain-containing protein n=1 Tax=Chryseobacterium sp. TaxID=1871047 RepID=UPI0028527E96|nr:RHS repeat-associated core domain-containing protein [Chryseobacterium sp.]
MRWFYFILQNRYIYQYKDHLGNARVSFAKNSEGALEVTDTNNYYPFGLNHIEGMFSTSNFGGYYSYKYNGKELQESGMYDYGARFYMPDIGRWGVIDPLAETDRRWTPYRYAYNNPIRFIDPDGRNEDIYELDRNGSITWRAESDRDIIYASKNFDSNGNLKEKNDGGVDVGEAGYIEKHTKEGNVEYSNGSTQTYSIIDFDNEKKALGVHEYISDNSDAEFIVSTGLKDGSQQSIIGKDGALDKPATPGAVSIYPFINYFDSNSISLFGHNHPDNVYEIGPSGYDIKMTGRNGNDFEKLKLPGKAVKQGDKNSSSSFPRAATLFIYNPSYYVGPKTVYYNQEEVTSIKNGYHKK